MKAFVVDNLCFAEIHLVIEIFEVKQSFYPLSHLLEMRATSGCTDTSFIPLLETETLKTCPLPLLLW